MASPSKEQTPANSAAASDSKPAVTFTEKEEKLLKVAWSCLKSGPPEVDLKKLTQMGGFNTEKTCSNTWGVIKKKLAQLAPSTEGSEDTGKTPTKAKATPKKRGKKATEGDDDEQAPATESPTKKQRKSPTKKKAVKAEEDEAETDEKVKEDVKPSIESADE